MTFVEKIKLKKELGISWTETNKEIKERQKVLYNTEQKKPYRFQQGQENEEFDSFAYQYFDFIK